MTRLSRRIQQAAQRAARAQSALQWTVQPVNGDEGVGPVGSGWVMEWSMEADAWVVTHQPSGKNCGVALRDSLQAALAVQYMATHAPCPEAEVVDLRHVAVAAQRARAAVDAMTASGGIVEAIASLMNGHGIGFATVPLRNGGGSECDG